MTTLWQWLTEWWVEHQAFKPRRTTPHVRSPVYTPVVGIAEEAYLRWLLATRGAG